MIARRAAAGLALVAVVLLVLAEFTTIFDVTVGSLEVVQRSSTAGENHGYALLVVALVAAPMTVLALRGARAPALALVVLGVVALAIALVVDLPATNGSGGLPESLAYEQAQAHARAGFVVELVGAVALLAAGVLLARANRPPTRPQATRSPATERRRA